MWDLRLFGDSIPTKLLKRKRCLAVWHRKTSLCIASTMSGQREFRAMPSHKSSSFTESFACKNTNPGATLTPNAVEHRNYQAATLSRISAMRVMLIKVLAGFAVPGLLRQVLLG